MNEIIFNNKYISLLITTIIICIIYKYISNYEVSDENKPNHKYFGDDFHNYISKYKFYDENDNLINHFENEVDEQYFAYKYIEENDIVLELGGRYGSVSVVINSLLNNKNNQVVIEPDTDIIDALTKNRDNNDSNFIIVNKFISNKNKKLITDGYSTRIIDNNDKNNNQLQITYQQFKNMYPLKFNVLIADCEGCFYEFILMLGNDLNNYNKIIYEEDQPEICNYSKVKQHLISYGFKLIEEKFNVVNRCIYMK
jgi:FkbM family methyltransferase